MTVLNITSDSGDSIVYGRSTSFATARSTSTDIGSTGTTLTVGSYGTATEYFVHRAFLKFNTNVSQLKGAKINSMKLSLTCIDDNSVTFDITVQIVEQDWSAQDPLAAGNREAAYDNCLAAAASINWRSTSGMSVNTPYLSSALTNSYLNTTGYTYYSLRSDRDYNNSSPGLNASDRIGVGSSTNLTEAYRSMLVIDYTPASTQGIAFLSDYGVL